MGDAPVFSRPVRVEAVPSGGLTQRIEANETERAALARLNGLQAIGSLTAELRLTRAGKGGVRVRGDLSAEVVQTCVVTLEPLPATVSETIDVRFSPESAAHPRTAPPDLADAGGEEPPDPIVDGRVDLGALAAEFLALGLDPWPRKAGATFAGESGAD